MSAPYNLASILVLIASLLTRAGVQRSDPWQPSPHVATFTAEGVWDGDNGTTVTRTGLRYQTAYRFDALAHRVALATGGACCFSELVPSPTDDRLAYFTFGADPPVTDGQKAVTGVRVVASDGSQVGWFAGCQSPCWSRDGTRLAMIETGHDANGMLKPAAVRVANRRGRSVNYPFQPQRIAWGNGDTLYLQFENRVQALELARGKSWPTEYLGCEVSADGEFSFRYRGQFSGFSVRGRAAGVEVAHCLLKDLGVDTDEARVMSPFWLRSATRKHLLCFSVVTVATGDTVRQANGQLVIMNPAKSPPGQRGVRTVVFDPATLEVLRDLPGKVVAPTNDHRALVMLLGDTLSCVRLPEWPPAPARPALGRIHVQVTAWGSGAFGPSTKLVTDSTLTVVAGDWLPGPIPWCTDRIRVAEMHADSLLELHLPAGMFVNYEEPNAGRHAARLLLGRAPVRLSTASVDGGYYVDLARVP